MKRDDDFIRDLLLDYEKNPKWVLTMPGRFNNLSDREEREKAHILMMMDEGLVVEVADYRFRISSQGHDYLETIRDDDIWSKTKDGAAMIGGATLGMMKDLAIAYVKQEAATKLGVNL